jgi:hypothetical protein
MPVNKVLMSLAAIINKCQLRIVKIKSKANVGNDIHTQAESLPAQTIDAKTFREMVTITKAPPPPPPKQPAPIIETGL